MIKKGKTDKVKAQTITGVSSSIKSVFLISFVFLFLLNFISAQGFVLNNPSTTLYTGNLTNLSEMQDVTITNPQNLQFLRYSSASGKWIQYAFDLDDYWDYDYSDLINEPTFISNFTNDLGYYNSTSLQNVSQLINDNNYWNDTYATFNKTYADTIYAPLGSAGNPFDQDLNTTDSVEFVNVTSSGYFVGDGSQLTGITGGRWNVSGSNLYPENLSYNVGIGTSSPGAKLHIKDTATTKFIIEGTKTGTGTVGQFHFYNDDDSIAGINVALDGADDSGELQFLTQLTTGTLTQRMVIDSSGNVGIRTTDPEAALDIVHDLSDLDLLIGGDITTGGRTDSVIKYSRIGMTHYDLSEQPVGILIGTSETAKNDLYFGGGSNAVNAATNIYFKTGADSTTLNGDTRMAIKSGGNVGIGTTAPQNKLDIEGGAVIGSTYSGTNTAPTDGLLVEGNVGIGTTTPQNELNVIGDGNFTGYVMSQGINLTALNSTGLIQNWSESIDLSGYVPYVGANQNLVLGDNNLIVGSTDFIVDSSTGNVGIGDPTPDAKLDVMGVSNSEGSVLINDYEIKFQNTGQKHWSIFNNESTGKFLISDTSSSEAIGYEGNPRFIIDTSGDVGIGDPTPDAKLDVEGQIGATEYCDENGNNCIDIINVVSSSDLTGYATWAQVVNGTMASTAYVGIVNTSMKNYVDSLPFGSGSLTGAGTTMRIPLWNGTTSLNNSNIYQGANGNIGIGTDSPEFPIDVKGTASALQLTNSDYVSGSSGSRVRFEFGSSSGNTYTRIQTTDAGGVSASDLVLQADSGNVGIGTTSPDAKLEIEGTSSDLLELDSSQTAGWMEFKESNSARGYFGYGDGGSIFSGASTDSLALRAQGDLHLGGGGNNLQMTLDGTNVGIGTTSPGYKLDVAGQVNAHELLVNGTPVGTGSGTLSGSGTAMRIPLWNGTTSLNNSNIYQGANGNIGIGGLPASSSYPLRVHGNLWADAYVQIQQLAGSGGVGVIDWYSGGSTYEMGVYGPHGSEGVKGIMQLNSQDLAYTTLANEILHSDTDFLDNPTFVIRSRNTAADSYAMFNYKNDSGLLIKTSSPSGDDSSITFKTESGSNLLINGTTGNVGIGTTTPQNELNVIGDINVTGTIYNDNYYAEGWFGGNMTEYDLDITSTMQFYNLTNWTQGDTNGFTFENEGLTVEHNGTYFLSGSVTFTGGNGGEYGFVLLEDGVPQQDCAMGATASTSIRRNVAFSCLHKLNEDEHLNIAVRDTGSPSQDITIYKQNFNIHRIGN